MTAAILPFTPSKQIKIQTMAGALRYGDEWRVAALRWQAHAERMGMLLFISQQHERASEILLEHAQAEIERLRALVE